MFHPSLYIVKALHQGAIFVPKALGNDAKSVFPYNCSSKSTQNNKASKEK
jgi:hypothetical protein